jgi:SAM-dependent methyltransferase
MRNIDQWQATKFVVRNGKLFSSKKENEVGFKDRLIVQFIGSAYQWFIPKYCNGNLIDIGCGNVPMFEFYRNYVDSVTTVDWAESIHTEGAKHLDIIADLNTSPIPELENNSFDSAICSDVLEHIYEPKILLYEIHRVLKQNGILLLNVPFTFPVHESPHDYYRYTEWALKSLMKDNGFEIIRFEYLGGIVASWITLTTQGLYGFGFIGKLLAAITQNVVCFLLRFKLWRRFLSYRSDLVPLGYFIAARKL